jgi:hypothetical protein
VEYVFTIRFPHFLHCISHQTVKYAREDETQTSVLERGRRELDNLFNWLFRANFQNLLKYRCQKLVKLSVPIFIFSSIKKRTPIDAIHHNLAIEEHPLMLWQIYRKQLLLEFLQPFVKGVCERNWRWKECLA